MTSLLSINIVSSNKLRETALFLLVLNYCCTLSSAAALSRVSRQAPKKCVYLKNAHYGEYLHTALTNGPIPLCAQIPSSNLYGNRIFTWRRKENISWKDWERTRGQVFENQAVWIFQRISNSCPNCFTIKSAFYEYNSEPLYAVSSLDHAFELARPRRPVYTYRGLESFPSERGQNTWEIEIVPNFSNRIRIKVKNIGDIGDEYLYAAEDDRAHDQERRNVFTWSSSDNSNINTWNGVGDWIVESASCPPYI